MKTRRQFLSQTLKGIAGLSVIAFLGMKVPEVKEEAFDWGSVRNSGMPPDVFGFGNTVMHVDEDGITHLTASGWEPLEPLGHGDWTMHAIAPNGEEWTLHHDQEEQVWAWAQVSPPTRGQG